ncbi:MAG: hypothetical protein O3B98_00505 [Actinobacteria bacterium]|nr:hypothetical protein [Actinomycetota bacterium]
MRVTFTSATLLTAIFLAVGVSPATAFECTHAERTSGQCSGVGAVVTGEGVTVSGTQVTPGSSGSSPRGSWSPPPPRDPILGSAQCEVKIAGLCRGTSPSKGLAEPVAPTPPSSLSDVAQFAPGDTSFVQEPAGWSLPLLPMNVFSTAQSITESGELLGWPIEVRFTPVSYRWSLGDGATRVSSSPGSTWGPRQFSTTDTSHVYVLSGDYLVSHWVTYEASYRFDQGSFVSLSGQITRSGGQRMVEVLSVTPVLVDRGCHAETLVSGRC